MAVTTSPSTSTTDDTDAKCEGAIARDGDVADGNSSDTAELVPIPSVVDYVVKRGDTLYEIAVTHGTTTQAIAEASDIGIRRTIEVGETLRVPLNAQRASFAVRSRYGLVLKHSTVGTTPASKRLHFLKRSMSALGPKKRTTEVASWSTPVSLVHATRAHTFGSGTILAFGLLAIFSQARSNRVRTRVASALSTKAAPTDESLSQSTLTGERATSSINALRADIREATEPAESERPVVVTPPEKIKSTTSTAILRDAAAESTQMALEMEKPLEIPKEETGSTKEDASSSKNDKETKTKKEGREAFVEMNAISGVKTTAIVVDVDGMESKADQIASTGREKEAPKRRVERVSKLSQKAKRSASQSRRRLSTPNVKVDEVEDLGYLPAALIGKGVYVAQVAFDFTRALMDKAFKKLSS
jgi:LysM repeat protein